VKGIPWESDLMALKSSLCKNPRCRQLRLVLLSGIRRRTTPLGPIKKFT
jgi:hypothetical protein